MSKFKSDQNIAMILLAAGEASRTGQPKQMLPWKGSTLIQHAICQGISSHVGKVYVVLGAYYEQISSKIDSNQVKIIYNPQWQSGMGSSLSKAVTEILKNNQYRAILIGLVDQPLIDTTVYNTLIEKYLNSNKGILAVNHHGKPGVPAVIDKKYFNQISQLKDDQGARHILRNNLDNTVVLDLKDKIVDIDTLEEYKILFEMYGK